MRQTQILSLLQSGYTTVEVSYNTSGVDVLDLRENNRLYTFKTNLTLQEGDLVVVPASASGFKVVTVVNVHEEPQLDLDATYDYKWVADRVDLAAYDEILSQEKDALKVMVNLERDARRVEAQTKLKELYGDKVPCLDYSSKDDTL